MESLGFEQLRVAILDDHPLVREGLVGAFQHAGYEVLTASGEPHEFLRAVDASPPAVAIVDLLLDGHDGVEVVEDLRRRHPQVPVVVLSAVRDPQVVERCLELGVSAYLEKLSSGHQAVLHTVEAVRNGRRVFPADRFHAARSEPVAQREPELLQTLTPRERAVLELVARGEDNLKIAARLGVSERTVKAHVSALYRKLEQENRAQLVLVAVRLGVAKP